MTEKAFYLAYGSNLHPLRLGLRVPGCRLVGRVHLPDCQLSFHKRGQDDSGKCNLTLGRIGARSYAALYQFDADQQDALDRWERGYTRQRLTVVLEEEKLEAFTYLAHADRVNEWLRPFDWYRALVRAGLRYLGCPPDYLSELEGTAVAFDNHPERAAIHQQLLKQLLDYNRVNPAPVLSEGRLLAWHQDASTNA
ncbi:gamma-glutamylcyclotransferase family protein [Motiliproteus sp. SC1-56]|uniref:gamma-glutamylcyclotransferase family protein n=1 Tax=Motiliproteus sp. SC1-56 TaxID=2799565 RepID=UPI001A9048EE|nr:gamma-glutamylcyclotransferase family protein [Motiliproteus sp. SC1-56]